MLQQVDLIRGRTLRLVDSLRIWISCLPDREQTALEMLTGPQGQKTYTEITDFILVKLGHVESEDKQQPGYRATHTKAKNLVPPASAAQQNVK